MILGFLRALLYFIAGLPVTLLGLPVVALALPFKTVHADTFQPFSQYAQFGGWVLVTLPTWAKWWSNEFDGALGDKRGWWANYCHENYGKACTDFYSMWQWLAIRNPANWWSRVITGVDMARCRVDKIFGLDVVTEKIGAGFEWQLLCATRDDGVCFPRFYLVAPWLFNPGHALMIDIGWKVKLSHNNTTVSSELKDRLKGSVFTLSPWKSL